MTVTQAGVIGMLQSGLPASTLCSLACGWAKSALADIRRIKDYSCTVVKRERVGDSLAGPQSMIVKVRHEPFSVYLRFAEPAKLRGREAIYVDGQNHDKLLAARDGCAAPIAGNRGPVADEFAGHARQSLSGY